MSGRRGRDWATYRPAPRKEVEGGVAVGKPGAVTVPAAEDLVAAAVLECEPQILPRGRTYARAGQVMAVAIADGEITGQIQGTGARPYEVRLFRTRISGADRVGAACTCPYGCDDGWCKHAAALAYVGAALIDRDAVLRGAWTGEAPQGAVDGVVPASAVVVDDAVLAVLRSAPPDRDPAQVLAWAAGIVPLP
jgi:hypothetical protein